MDGDIVYRTSKDTQVLRIVPTADAAKLAAAQGVFHRYATEAVTFFELARWLNSQGIRNSFGNKFQGRDVEKMLEDESYLGYPTFSKRRNGRFHRHDAEGVVVELEPELRGKYTRCDPADVVRTTTRFFDPIVDRKTWEAVQRKLRARVKVRQTVGRGTEGETTRDVLKNPAARKASMYLAGLVVCANCGQPMTARTDRGEYYCSTWNRKRIHADLANSRCERNAVRHSVLEEYVHKFLEETGRRLEVLKGGDDGGAVKRIVDTQWPAWRLYFDAMNRLTDYLKRYAPDDWAVLAAREEFPAEDDGWTEDAIAAYRANFDPAVIEAEIDTLEKEHTRLIDLWSSLPTPRAKEKVKAQFEGVESRMEELKAQQQDAAAVVEARGREIDDLMGAIHKALESMSGDAASLRHRAEALRGVLCRIELEFVLTGKTGTCTVKGRTRNIGGAGNTRSRLVGVTFVPVAGDGLTVPVEGQDVYSRSQGNP
jgi:hypothetical protein